METFNFTSYLSTINSYIYASDMKEKMSFSHLQEKLKACEDEMKQCVVNTLVKAEQLGIQTVAFSSFTIGKFILCPYACILRIHLTFSIVFSFLLVMYLYFSHITI